MIKLMIKSRFLPLNVDSFFDFKLKSCGSVIQDAKTQLLDLTLKNHLVAVAKHLWLNKFAHNVLNLSIWFSLICGGALIPGLIGSSAFVEMIRMVQTGGSFAGVYRGTGTDIFGESVLWLIVGLDAKESFSRSFKASVVEEICPQCFESFKRCKKKQPQQKH